MDVRPRDEFSAGGGAFALLGQRRYGEGWCGSLAEPKSALESRRVLFDWTDSDLPSLAHTKNVIVVL